MTADELRNTQDQYERAARRYDAARTKRNARIAQALADGWTHAAIAKATGLTRGRVGQLASPT
jgi:DNA-binding NarL/FixJ family response regulator